MAEPPAKRSRQKTMDVELAKVEDAIILLVGMRSAGKTTLGRETAQVLGFDFVDLDEHITQQNDGKLPPQIVEERGWPGFRDTERDSLRQAVDGKLSKDRPLVVACGGGVVETEASMEILRSHWPVVFVERDIEAIATTLREKAGTHRASLGEDPKDTYARRLPRYLECLDFRIWMWRKPEVMAPVLAGIARHFLGRSALYIGPDTFFLSATLPQYDEASTQQLRSALPGADLLELRVDLLASYDFTFIAEQVASLRAALHGIPILFTVRSKREGGKFAGSAEEYCALCRLGIQLGCEMVDVECSTDAEVVAQAIARRGHTSIIGSFHDFHRMPDQQELQGLFERCRLSGAAAVTKVVAKAFKREDCWRMQEAAAAATSDGRPFIGLCLGNEGKLSRVLNQVLTPCTHPSMPIAAPGQLSVEEILRCRDTLCLASPQKQFPVIGPFGHQMLDSAATALEQAFQEHSLPHVCRVVPVFHVEEVRRILGLASVGGALVAGEFREALGIDVPAAAVHVVLRGSGDSDGESPELRALQAAASAFKGAPTPKPFFMARPKL